MLVVCQTDISRVHSTNIRTMSELSPTNVRLIVKQKLSVFCTELLQIHTFLGRSRSEKQAFIDFRFRKGFNQNEITNESMFWQDFCIFWLGVRYN